MATSWRLDHPDIRSTQAVLHLRPLAGGGARAIEAATKEAAEKLVEEFLDRPDVTAYTDLVAEYHDMRERLPILRQYVEEADEVTEEFNEALEDLTRIEKTLPVFYRQIQRAYAKIELAYLRLTTEEKEKRFRENKEPVAALVAELVKVMSPILDRIVTVKAEASINFPEASVVFGSPPAPPTSTAKSSQPAIPVLPTQGPPLEKFYNRAAPSEPPASGEDYPDVPTFPSITPVTE